MWTVWAAAPWASRRLGSIEPGKYADMAVIRHHAYHAQGQAQGRRVTRTIVGGETSTRPLEFAARAAAPAVGTPGQPTASPRGRGPDWPELHVEHDRGDR